MTIHLIHTTRHSPRSIMSESRRLHVHGRLLSQWEDVRQEEALLACAAGDRPQRSTLQGIGYTIGFIVGFIGTFAVVFASLA